jgi:hypothetical protein
MNFSTSICSGVHAVLRALANTVRLWTACILALWFTACSGFVTAVDVPINSLDDTELTSEDHVEFLINGVRARFASTYALLGVLSGTLSDELRFELVEGATEVTYRAIDAGYIPLDANLVILAERQLGELRYLADNLAERAQRITFRDQNLRRRALTTAYFYGAFARYFYAAYFGLEPQRGGGVINVGPFIPSAAMYDSALARINLALQHVTNAYERRAANTFIARIHLLNNRFAQAEAAARNGLRNGDPTLVALFSKAAPSWWWAEAGAGRVQVVVDRRFEAYLRADPNEEIRIPIVDIEGLNGTDIFYAQDRYPEQDSPIPVLTWQENDLMLAECELRLRNDVGAALLKMNAVRASSELAPLDDATLQILYTERDKELFCTGNRLLDQRRFNRWHLPADTWRCLPITNAERNANPNLRP